MYPIFKPHYLVEIIPDEGVLFLSESGDYRLIQGKFVERLAYLLLHHQPSEDELLQQLQDEYSSAEVYYHLLQLEQKNLLTYSPNRQVTPEQCFWSGFDNNPEMDTLLQTKTLSIVSLGSALVQPQVLSECLANMSLRVVSEKVKSDLQIVITDDYCRKEIESYAQQSQQQNQSWLLVKPNGFEAWLGPVFIPGKAGCYRCLKLRLLGNRIIESYFLRQPEKNHLITSKAALPLTLRIAYEQTTLEVCRFLQGDGSLHAKTLSIHFQTRSTKLHQLIHYPDCPNCGSQKSTAKSVKPIRLTESALATAEGGYRSVSAEETLRKYEHLVSPIGGLVSELTPRIENKIFVYTAGFNKALQHNQFNVLKKNLRHQSSGKGLTATQAKTSALCEALERYSGASQGQEFHVQGSYQALQDKAIHPNHCMLFSDNQFEAAEYWNQKGYYCRVPAVFDPAAQVDWTKIWSLTHKDFRLLPTQYLYYDYDTSANISTHPIYCHADSNGCASGNNLEEAILQGFFELVERDATAIWWYNRLTRPAVDLASFQDPAFSVIQQHYQTIHRRLWVLDITHDFTIPTFVACSAQTELSEKIIFGFGCHPNAKLAISRALTEMNQMLMNSQDLSSNLRETDTLTYQWFATATLAEHPHLIPDSTEIKTANDYPLTPNTSALSQFLYYQRLIESLGLELLVLDQTREEVGLSVVRVVIPGLRPWWPRFAHGRLYDVPVKLGWRNTPLLEAELNPFPLFF